jgi:hypothetical protein
MDYDDPRIQYTPPNSRKISCQQYSANLNNVQGFIAWRVFQGEKLLNKLLGCPLMVSLLTGTTK